MTNTSKIKKAITQPWVVPGHIYRSFVRSSVKSAYYERYRRSNSIPEQKPLIYQFLDNDEFALIILDACRFDEFSRICDDYIDGELQKVWAAGRWTKEYASRTWTKDPETYDFTYINSAPVITDLYFEQKGYGFRPDEKLRNKVEVWDTCWDTELNTIPAEAVTDAALAHAEPGPTRLVAHYMQPHVPYVGEYRVGEDQQTDSEQPASDAKLDRTEIVHQEANKPTYDLLKQIESGKISDRELRRAYRSNLEYVLDEVQRLIRHLDCPVIITSDHGEHLGEDGKYLHESDSTQIREIPWYVVSDHEIKGENISEELTETYTESDSRAETTDEVKDRLEKLGYVD